MLALKSIVKEYTAGDINTKALKGINIEFRDNEFVFIIGPSGCGKTSMLNIVGGLDRYTSGDLGINRKSTKEFLDREWDAYRNNCVGFVFQSYNLIPNQTVLANVELALALSGVSKVQRRERAIAVLTKVGLDDQLHKKQDQISCGQMQRVAIARALVKDSNILLLDEPTSALDSVTSVAVMEILKEIAQNKLIIIVTNNIELAEKYATRILKMIDGNVINDSNPYYVVVEKPFRQDVKKKREKKTARSFFIALSLSMHHLIMNKVRTFMTLLVGSIGIFGIAFLWTLSNSAQTNISNAFVAILVVVLSIMIGSITFISVLERTKEIGIMRCMGASKKDISRLFNIETFIIGLIAGIIGVGVTYMNIKTIPGTLNIVFVIISLTINILAGWIPSRIAAKKDPIVLVKK